VEKIKIMFYLIKIENFWPWEPGATMSKLFHFFFTGGINEQSNVACVVLRFFTYGTIFIGSSITLYPSSWRIG
jgi:hypothetical protein